MSHRETYPPLDVLKPVADGVWIVDSGPMHALGLKIPVRMTVVRLADGGLWLHSPTPFAPALHAEMERIGPVRHLVAPNIAHWTFVKDWQPHCPGALAWAAPGLRQRAQVKASGVAFDRDLGPAPPPEWGGEFDQLVLRGGFGVSEVLFHHRASRTAILTDLVQNFEPPKVHPLLRPLLRAVGSMGPDGKAPAHFRFVINRRRRAAAAVAQQLVALAPERVMFAHGRWFEQDGAARLRHSLRWLLD